MSNIIFLLVVFIQTPSGGDQTIKILSDNLSMTDCYSLMEIAINNGDDVTCMMKSTGV